MGRWGLALHTAVAAGVAPVAGAGGAAEGADAEEVFGAGGEGVDGHGAGVGEEARTDPGAGGAAGADEGALGFVVAGVGDGGHAHEDLAGVAVAEVGDLGLGQRLLGVVGADGVESAGEEFGHVVAVVGLDVAGELARTQSACGVFCLN